MENISQMSMLEVAVMLMEQKRTAQPVKKIIKEVLEVKGTDDLDGTIATQLYIDITTSSKFVYMGNEEWDLKNRQSLDEWDKDGSAFNTKEDLDEEEVAAVIPVDSFDDDLDSDEEEIDEEEVEVSIDEEEIDEEDAEDEEEIDEEETVEYVEEDIIDDDYMDEDKYNDYMDNYEDMYDEE